MPLILVTADRPWELQGFGAPQTMEQPGLYGRFVRGAENLATPEDTPPMFAQVRAVAARAFVTAANAPRGPVHVNAPFREPLAPTVTAAVSVPSQTPRFTGARLRVADEAIDRVAKAIEHCERGLIVVGPRAPDAAFAEAVHALGEKLGFPLLAEAASNVRFGCVKAIAHYDAMLRHAPFAKAHLPQVVLRFGGGLTPKTPQAWLDNSGARIFTFSDEGAYIDPQHSSEEILIGEAADACRALSSRVKAASSSGYLASWTRAHDRVRQVLSVLPALSEPWVAQAVAAALPERSQLVVSSSMPVRDLDAFANASKPGLKVFTNRALNGIDGVVSTALGISAGSNAPTSLLIGDVAMLHDLGGWAAARRLGVGLNAIVINNDGGGIFHFLPVADSGAPFEEFFGTPHGTDFATVATLGGASYHRVDSVDQLVPALRSATGKRRLVEIQTNRQENVKVHAQLFDAAARALGDGPWL